MWVLVLIPDLADLTVPFSAASGVIRSGGFALSPCPSLDDGPCPSLDAELAQRDGQFHVHADDCPDHQHYGPEGKFGGVDDYGDRITVSSREEIVKFVYPPGEFGYAEPDWREFDDLYVAPCVSLPDEAPRGNGQPA